MRTPVLSVVFAACCFQPLWAATAEQKDGDRQLADAVRGVGTACGVPIAATYDWNSERAAPGKPGYQGPVYCRSIVDAVANACGDAEAKAVIAGAIKTITCRFEANASKRDPGGGPVLEHAGTVLNVVYDWNSSNLESETYTWLTRKLRTPWPNGMATVEERKEKKDGEKQFAEAIAALNSACGTSFDVAYDWSSEKTSPAKPAWQGFLYCRGVVNGLKDACSDGEIKAALAAGVKSIQCRFEEGASSNKQLDAYAGPVLQHEGSVLRASYDWKSANLDSQTYKWAARKMLVPGDNGPVTVEARKERKEGLERLAQAVTALNAACGANVTAEYAFSSEKAAPASPAWQGYLYCKNVLDGLARGCGNAKSKARFAKTVKTVACVYDAKATRTKGAVDGLVLGTKGGRLEVRYDWTSANLESNAARWLDKP